MAGQGSGPIENNIDSMTNDKKCEYIKWTQISLKSRRVFFVVWSFNRNFKVISDHLVFRKNLSTNLMTFLTRICTFCCQIPGLGIHKNVDLLSLIKLLCEPFTMPGIERIYWFVRILDYFSRIRNVWEKKTAQKSPDAMRACIVST